MEDPHYQIGEKVWVWIPVIRKGDIKKFARKWNDSPLLKSLVQLTSD